MENVGKFKTGRISFIKRKFMFFSSVKLYLEDNYFLSIAQFWVSEEERL